jgi:ribosomal protein S18 acetylase RimI-like enzyme
MKRVKLFEEFTANMVTCDNCDWSWEIEEGGKDVFLCHKCNHDNTPVLGEQFILQELEDQFNIELDLYDNGKYLQLSKIKVKKEDRDKGIGSKVMSRITDYADTQKLKIYLTPSKDFGATSISRLNKFYKNFDFVKNIDKSQTKDTMVRQPK